MADKQATVSPAMAQFLQQEQARSAIRQTVATMTEVRRGPVNRPPPFSVRAQPRQEHVCHSEHGYWAARADTYTYARLRCCTCSHTLRCNKGGHLTIHWCAQVCWDKCMGSPGSYLSSREEACFQNCARSFLATTQFIVQVGKHCEDYIYARSRE